MNGAAVRERPVDGEVDAVLAAHHRRAVERAAAVRRLGAAALRALVRRPVDAVLDEEQLDTSVGGSLERLLPARGRAAVLAGLLAPALEQRLLALAPPLVEHAAAPPRAAASVGVRLRRRPAGEAVPRFLREQLLELGADLLRADEHDRHAAQPAARSASSVSATSRRCCSTRFSMWRSYRACDQPPWSCRPGTSVLSSAISTSGAPRSRNTSPRSRPTAATSAPSRPTCDASGARYSSFGDLDVVGDAARKRKRAPEVVEGRREHGDASHAALAVEAVVEPLPDPLDVGLQPLPLVVGRGRLPLVRQPLCLARAGS